METITKVSDMEQEIQTLKAIAASQSEQIAKLEALVKFYEERFKLSQRHRFGTSSEQSPDQLRIDNWFNEAEAQADPSLPEPTYEQVSYARKKRVGKREEDLGGLPIERIDYELPESERSCPNGCEGIMDDIGVTVRRELKIVPAQVVCVEHAVHAYGCQNCQKSNDNTPIIRADAPTPLISGSLASPSAVAYIAAQKYQQGMPLYRTERSLTDDGVILSRQTMSNWLVYCAGNYLLAFYMLLITFLLNEEVLHSDSTSVQVLHEPQREAQAKSTEWLYRSGIFSEHPVVIYIYREGQKQDHPSIFLKNYKGHLHCDGEQGYHKLSPDIIVAGCWSHCRRYFEKAYEALPKNKRDGTDAELGLVYCNLMFWLEYEYRSLQPDEILEKRLKFSKLVSNDFFKWAGSLEVVPKSLLGQAAHYALAQREYLENVYRDGRLELSNNLAERSIKAFVQGRKAWIFSNTPNGAESSSIFYSIIETARANNLHPREYLQYLLEKLPTTEHSDMQTLLPWSESLPDYCRVPVKSSNKKPEKPKYFTAKGSLHLALLKLREKYIDKDAAEA
jgi:transposase